MKSKAGPAIQDVPYKDPEDRPKGPFAQHEVEHAVRHLARAKRIMKNKSLMGAVRKHSKKMAADKRQEADEMEQIHTNDHDADDGY